MIPRWLSEDGAAQGPVVATCTCACMAGTGDTRTLPDCCDPAGRFPSRLRGCLAVGDEGGRGRQAGRRAGRQASGTDRIVGAERHYSITIIVQGFDCLRPASRHEQKQHRTGIAPSPPRDAGAVEKKRCAGVRES
jgi:hypothetical protein